VRPELSDDTDDPDDPAQPVDDLILMMRVPDRPSRLKSISIPKVRSNVWARRSRPARARGLLGQPAFPDENPAGAALARSRSDALPDHVEQRAMD
jgi:hypothetical protein